MGSPSEPNRPALLTGLLATLAAPPLALVYGRAWLYQSCLRWPRGLALGISLLSAGFAGAAALVASWAIATLSGCTAGLWPVVLGGLAAAVVSDAAVAVWAARERGMWHGPLTATALLAALLWWPIALVLFVALGWATLALALGLGDAGAPPCGG
jgi:hypothetical protein